MGTKNGNKCGGTLSATDAHLGKRDPEVESILSQIKGQVDNVEISYLKIGQLLLDAKEHFGKYGNWLEFLDTEVPLSRCKAQRLMKIAKLLDPKEATQLHLTYSQAYALCALSGKKRAEFLQCHNVREMSSRDITEEIRLFLQPRKGKSESTTTSQSEPLEQNSTDAIQKQVKSVKSSLCKLVDSVNLSNETDSSWLVTELENFRTLCGDAISKLSFEER